jgi:predicted dehydrogenase
MLEKYGYKDVAQFLNWRHYKKYGGGPICDLGAHQLGVFGWFLGARPKGIVASGGVDYYKEHELPDNVMTIIDYETPEGVSRAFYEVLTTTGSGGYFETFMGVDGTMKISEDPKKCMIFSEGRIAPTQPGDPHPWDKWLAKKYLLKAKEEKKEEPKDEKDPNAALLDAYKSPPPVPWLLNVEPEDSYHLPHLQNFLGAVRNGTPLNCPAEVGFVDTATVLKVNEAIGAGKRLECKPEDFTA